MSFLDDIFSGASDKANKFNAQAQQVYAPDSNQLAAIQGQQQSYANMLSNQAMGNGGPSAADVMLKNAQQQNTAQANALAASQQGSVNSGLATRNAQMQAATANQNVAGQAAQQRMQEQLNAQSMLGGQLNNMFQQGVGAQGMNQAAGLQAQGLNADVISKNAERSSKSGAGLLGGISGLGGLLADGGMVRSYDDGGKVMQPEQPQTSPNFIAALGKAMKGMQAPAKNNDAIYQGSFDVGSAIGSGLRKAGSSIVDYLNGPSASAAPAPAVPAGMAMAPAAEPKEQEYLPSMTRDAGPMANGGKMVRAANGMLVKKPLPPMKGVKALVSPGEGYLPPHKVEEVLKGADPLRVAHKVPGKASVRGDSLKNDTVPAELEEGGVVIPRTKMMSPEKAAAFVRRAVAKKGMK